LYLCFLEKQVAKVFNFLEKQEKKFQQDCVTQNNNVCLFFDNVIENLMKHVFRLYNLKMLKKEFGLYNPNEYFQK